MISKLLVCILIGLGIAAVPRGQAAPISRPTYNVDILPLFEKYCINCHGPGSAMGNLMDYKTAKKKKDPILQKVTVLRTMPMGASSITDDERNLIGEWVKNKAPLGPAIATPTPTPIPTPSGTMIKHPPFEQKKCGSCHVMNPTGDPVPDKFVADQPDLCYKCHTKKNTGSVVHPAMGFGNCTTMCHKPHESSFRPLLQDKVINLCVRCHDAPGLGQAVVRHSAVDMLKSCVRCHNPHSANEPKLLRDKTQKLCVYCHTDIGAGIADPRNVVHPAIMFGCQACHEPHGSPNTRLFKKPLNDLCYQCHSPKNFQKGHPINGHPLAKAQDILHPERPFTCISCHKPHFSTNEKLFRYHPKQAPYDGTICSVCHWQKLLPPPGPPIPKWND